ncbi:MAG: cardiolipin synthase [Prevotella sp.]|nr:cardiolipin synthase [Prevotella sp.]
MQYLHWTFLLIYGLLVVGTMVTILMDNRQPAKAMAWILVLTFMPVVGLILYIFFGQNIRKERLITQQSLDLLTKRSMNEFAEQKDLTLPEEHRSLISLFINQSLALPFKDNCVEIYTTGHDYFLALLKAIGEAQHHIHIDTYIIEDDPLGRLVSDALIDRAREGIEVRLIYDDVGCWRVSSSFFERMREAGIEVRGFMPVHFPAFTSKINYRNHRKLVVIDGREAFVGGMNIAMRYVKGTTKKKKGKKEHTPWRDTQLCVVGGAVYGVQRAFLIDWYFVDRTLISGEKYYIPTMEVVQNDCIAQMVTSSPTSPWPDIMQGYVRILLEARQYVYMETPYFLPTEPILFAMRTAALAGVDVRLMIPRHVDSKLVEWASRSYVMETLEAGVKVLIYKAGFNHSKLLVSDDSLCTCGSTNIDFRSFENNFESNMFFYDRDLALRMKQVFLEDEQQCISVDELNENVRSPFLLRLWESVIRLLAPLL